MYRNNTIRASHADEMPSVYLYEEMHVSYETLLLDQDEAVLTITVNRPEVLNAQSRLMRDQ